MIAARALAQARMPISRSFQTSARRANTNAPRSADWSNIVKTRAKSALIYFPGLAIVLGWPLIASKALDGRM